MLAQLRGWVPNRPFLVGWKLLSGVSPAELLQTALRQAPPGSRRSENTPPGLVLFALYSVYTFLLC